MWMRLSGLKRRYQSHRASPWQPKRRIRERKLLDTPHLFLREGDSAPDGYDVTYIVRTYVDAPVREKEKLPVAVEQLSPVADPAPRQERLEYPNLGLA
jgi:hypothetical protein